MADLSYYIVVCRLCFDDEDSAYVLRCANESEAMSRAEHILREEVDASGNDPSSDDYREFVLNYIFDCGQTEPRQVL